MFWYQNNKLGLMLGIEFLIYSIDLGKIVTKKKLKGSKYKYLSIDRSLST